MLFGLVIISSFVLPTKASSASVSFGQETYEVSNGQEFQVEVKLTADEKIGVYDVQLQYDTARLEYVSGAEAEADGIVTLTGTGWGTEVTYSNLTFRAIAGGEAGISVKSAEITASGSDASGFKVNSSKISTIHVAGAADADATSFAEQLKASKRQEAQEEYGVATELPIIGTIQSGEQTLYVVNVSECDLTVPVWDYQTITETGENGKMTYLTDKDKQVYVLPVIDSAEQMSLWVRGRDGANYYPVSQIQDADGKKYYMMSLAGVVDLSDELTEEDVASDTIFYAVDEKGNGNYFQYTKDGELQKWNEKNTSVTIIVTTIVGLVLIGGVVIVMYRKRKQIKKRLKKGLVQANFDGSDKKQYFFVIRELTSREIKRKYARSYLGIIWSVLNPLLTMIVMSLIFSYMFKRTIENFPLYYLTGNLFWGLFSQGTNSAMTALVDNKNLLLKAKLPKQTFVLSRVYTSFVNFGYTCIAYVLMLLVFRIRPSWTMLLFIPDVILSLIFATGIGYILAIMYVFFADIKHLYGVLLTLLMYMSAIFYPVTSLPPILQEVIGYNPIYMMIYIAREAVVYNHVPHYSAWIKLGISAIVSMAIGLYVFRKKQNDVMQRV